MNLETIIQNKIRLALSKYGITLRLNTGSYKTKDNRFIKSGLMNGTADLLFISNKVEYPNISPFVFMEVKTEKGKLRTEQRKFLDIMIKNGHTAGVVRSEQDALRLIGLKE